MRELTLFHIGDVHYPQIIDESTADEKDSGFDDETRRKIAPKKLNIVMRDIVSRADSEKGNCIFLLSGDITTYGDEKSYKSFVEMLRHLLPKESKPSEIHVVPGNHDIVRNDFADNQQYDHMIRTWDGVYKDAELIRHDSVREETVTVFDSSSVTILSLNTCVGCGGKRRIVGDLRTKILDAISSDANPADFYEKLDTPAVDVDHLISVESSIKARSNGKNLPVILAHHNLLPQHEPRVEIYTELINSGSMRAHLLNTEIPLIVCHGHIHDDPIEIITIPESRGKLVVTSAPRITKGYNCIEIVVGERGFFLGCRIKHYRLQGGSTMSLNKTHTIRFCSTSEFHEKGHKRIMECLGPLNCDATTRGVDYRKLLRGQDTKCRKTTLMSILKEALWFGLVEISNVDEPDLDDWHIRKVVP
jgi:3',5'-cyclic AMP phosphodiesterase CpdA